MTQPILCAGRLYCDLVFANAPRLPTLGTEVFAPGLSLAAGGGAFITGAALAAAGRDVWQFSTLPAAPFDRVVVQQLSDHRIDTRACRPAARGTDPQITVAIGTAADRAFLTRADGPALPDLATVTFRDFAHLHIGELRTLQDHPALLAMAKAAGLTVSLDCSWQDDFDSSVADLIAGVDVFMPNQREAAALTALGVPEACAPLTVVKCGAKGARARLRDGDGWISAKARPAKVLDATGAGDAFNGGFLARWLDHAPLETCLNQGNAFGAATVAAMGGAGGLSVSAMT